MHIKPSGLSAIPPSVSASETRRSGASNSFQDLLQTAMGQPAAPPPSPAELATALRLRMLQQVCDFGDDDQETDSFPALDLLAALSTNKHPSLSQNIDFPASQPNASVAPPPTVSVGPPPTVSVGPLPAGVPASLPDIIDRAAARYQVAPEIVRAVIRAESGFNPNAVSPAGAQGLMQLMPGTARELGVTDPFDPEQNVMAGTRYLKQMLGRYGGDLQKALAAYNWGPGNLDRSQGGRLPVETRQYIARIQGFLAASG